MKKDSKTNIRYSKFRKDKYWDDVRKAIFERENGLCELCGSDGQQVHHKTYAIYGREMDFLDELALLCDKCHKSIHEGNPHCVNEITITIDSGLKKKELNLYNFNKNQGDLSKTFLVSRQTMWDDEYLLVKAKRVIDSMLSNIRRKSKI